VKRFLAGIVVLASLHSWAGAEVPLPAAAVATAPATQPTTAPAAVEIIMDTTEAPDMRAWAEKIQPTLAAWYPRIVAALPSDGYTAPTRVNIKFMTRDGVAFTVGTQIVCCNPWIKNNRRGESTGAIIHELVHVVQQYHHRGARNPGWLVEGIADYIRWFQYEPASQRPHPDPAHSKYSDSYRTTAAFLDWVTGTGHPDLVQRLNTACREGKYTDDLWKQITGKALADLGDEWKASLQAQPPSR